MIDNKNPWRMTEDVGRPLNLADEDYIDFLRRDDAAYDTDRVDRVDWWDVRYAPVMWRRALPEGQL